MHLVLQKKSQINHYFAILSYPLFIIGCLIAAWYFKSLIPAVVSLIPVLFILYSLFITTAINNTKRFKTTSHDFACNDSTYLNLVTTKSDGEPLRLDVYEKKSGFGNYNLGNTIVSFRAGKMDIDESNSGTIRMLNMKPVEYLTMCKNKEGKSPQELYPARTLQDSLDAQAKEVSLRKELLTGVWQNAGDPTEAVSYLQDGTWRVSHEGKTSSKGTWEFLTVYPESASGVKDKKGYFIKTTDSDGNSHYYQINSVDNDNLWRTDLASGVNLQYKKSSQ